MSVIPMKLRMTRTIPLVGVEGGIIRCKGHADGSIGEPYWRRKHRDGDVEIVKEEAPKKAKDKKSKAVEDTSDKE